MKVVKPIHIQKTFGHVEEGFYICDGDGKVTLVTQEGVPVVDINGREYTALATNGNAKQIAARLLRQSLPVSTRPRGFDKPIRYPKASLA
jgi:hypothetical protein